MNAAEWERFTADLQSNEALRVEAERATAGSSNGMAALADFAVNKGYGITLEQIREHVKAAAAATGKVLSDAELDGIAAAGTQCVAVNTGFLTGNNVFLPINISILP